MKLLALDTSTEACSVALLIDGAVCERYEVAPGAHSRLVLTMIEAVFAEAGMRLRDMDALAFGRGPGSFTGLRIAAGVVQGLAYGADRPVVPVSTLAAVAQGALATHQAEHVLTALDARMNEVYWGAYARAADGVMQAVQDEAVVAPHRVTVPDRGHWFGAGPGWASYREALTARVGARLSATDAALLPRAAHMLPIAAAAVRRGAVVSAELALPVYLRDQVAHRPGS